MKDLAWLKEEVEKLDKETSEQWPHEGMVELPDVLRLIDQLDEPEVLTSDWIDDNKKDSGVHYIGYYVPIGRLHNLLVPKQELPVIPDYVAEWIKTIRELNGDMVGALIDGNYNMEVGDWLFLDDDTVNVVNSEKLMSAWRNGYTVEEKKYYVIPPHKDSEGYKMYLTTTDDGELDEENIWFNTEVEKEHYSDKLFKYKFTKEEVKKIEKGAYWAFAVPVEELEE